MLTYQNQQVIICVLCSIETIGEFYRFLPLRRTDIYDSAERSCSHVSTMVELARRGAGAASA